MKGRFLAQEFESNEIPSTWSKIASFVDQKDHTWPEREPSFFVEIILI